jgi:hypothetical protein
MLETESVQSETARNFSRLFNESGYNLIVIESAEAAAAFMRALEARYVRGEAFDLRQQSSP